MEQRIRVGQNEEDKMRVTRGWRDEGNKKKGKKRERGREQIGVTSDKWMRND